MSPAHSSGDRDLILAMLKRGNVVTADAIAAQMGRSPRSVYRYLKAMRAEGVPIRGEKGVGFVLRKEGARK